MTILADLAKTIRSKNAGPDLITFDIIFDDDSAYERVKKSGVLTKELVAKLYGLKKSEITDFVIYDPGRAIKFTIRRKSPSGGVGETDVFGCQQYPPLFEIEIP